MKTISFQLVQQKPRTLAFFVCRTKTENKYHKYSLFTHNNTKRVIHTPSQHWSDASSVSASENKSLPHFLKYKCHRAKGKNKVQQIVGFLLSSCCRSGNRYHNDARSITAKTYHNKYPYWNLWMKVLFLSKNHLRDGFQRFLRNYCNWSQSMKEISFILLDHEKEKKCLVFQKQNQIITRKETILTAQSSSSNLKIKTNRKKEARPFKIRGLRIM